MKLSITRDELKEAVAGLGKVVNLRSRLPVLAHVRIDARGDALSLTGTDLCNTATYAVEGAGRGAGDGSAIVPFEALQSILKGAQGPVVEIETTGQGEVSLSCASQGHTVSRRVAAPELEDWPEPPKPARTMPVDARLLEHIRRAVPFAATEENRQVLKSVFLDVRNPACHRVVGCDSRRLTAFNSVRLPLEESAIVPTGKFLVWNKLEGETRVGADKEVFTLAVGPWTYTSKLAQGVYPSYEQVIPRVDNPCLLELAPEDIELLVRALPGLTDYGHCKDTVVLRLEQGAAQAYTRDLSGAESVLRLEHSDYRGVAMQIGINRNYWREALQAGFRLWEFADPCSPLLGRLSAEDKHSCHVLMPVRGMGDEGNGAHAGKPEEQPEEQPSGQPAKDGEAEEEAQPVPSPATPATTIPTTKTTKETPMPTPTTTNPMTPSPAKTEDPRAAAETGSLERILVAYESAKSAVREANAALVEVAATVREAIKEDRARRKEIADVRAGLAKLQAIRV
jgi:DNA polymerase III subunit beta